MTGEPQGEVQRVAEVVLGRILDGTYPTGLRMPTEAALASELGCGRSTVREALRHLADQGLVKSRRGSGAHVLDWRREGSPALLPGYVALGRFDVPPPALATAMLRIRTVMACEAVRLAAEHAPVGSLAEAEALLARAAEATADPSEHAALELEFYRALVRASRMWPAVWMVNALWVPLLELHRVFAPVAGTVRADFQPRMARLLGRIRAHDADGAVADVEAWFRRVDRELTRAIEALFGGYAAAPEAPAPVTRPRARRKAVAPPEAGSRPRRRNAPSTRGARP